MQTQLAMPRLTPVVKVLLLLCAALFVLSLALEASGFSLSAILGFVPGKLLQGWIWQPFTYAFLHAGVFHILFNLLVLWSIGSELEALWGSVNFIAYFFTCTVGAALCYGFFSVLGIGPGPMSPVVGSSGAVYGLLLAYGILFGNRVMYFFMLFPMPAKYFVMVLGAVELVSSVFYSKSGIAHLAHLGGMVSGFVFLVAMAAWRRRAKEGFHKDQERQERQRRMQRASHLKLVKEEDEDKKPNHWN